MSKVRDLPAIQDIMDWGMMDHKAKDIERLIRNIRDFYKENHHWGVRMNICHAINGLVRWFQDIGGDPKEIACFKIMMEETILKEIKDGNG